MRIALLILTSLTALNASPVGSSSQDVQYFIPKTVEDGENPTESNGLNVLRTKPYITHHRPILPGVPTPPKPVVSPIPLEPIERTAEDDDEEIMFHALPYFEESRPIPVEYINSPKKSVPREHDNISSIATLASEAITPLNFTSPISQPQKLTPAKETQLTALQKLTLWRSKNVNKAEIALKNIEVSSMRRQFEFRRRKWAM